MTGRIHFRIPMALILAAALALSCLSFAFAEDSFTAPPAEDPSPAGTPAAPSPEPAATQDPAAFPASGDPFDGVAWELITLWNGFTAPYPASPEYAVDYRSDASFWSYTDDSTRPFRTECSLRVYWTGVMAEDRETALAWYDANRPAGAVEVLETETVEVDGHPVRLYLSRLAGEEGDVSQGSLYYLRNNGLLLVRLLSIPQNGTAWEQLPKVTLDDLRAVLEKILYDPAAADATLADGRLEVSAGSGSAVLTAGKKLQFTAGFAGADRIAKLDKSLNADAVEWTVTDTETGGAPEGVTISAQGALSADKEITRVMQLEVKASAPFFGTEASCPVTVLPAVTKITVEPAEVVFFAGAETEAVVRAVLEPATVPPAGITWSVKKEGVAEVIPGEDGTAVLRPLAAGKINVTATEPGGKKASVSVNVVEPVQDVTLSVLGKAIPGLSFSVKASLSPKTAGVKTVLWSIDVGEDVAVISKGQVRVAKTAPVGTVITVTCTATGAPEPIVRKMKFTVGK